MAAESKDTFCTCAVGARQMSMLNFTRWIVLPDKWLSLMADMPKFCQISHFARITNVILMYSQGVLCPLFEDMVVPDVCIEVRPPKCPRGCPALLTRGVWFSVK